MRFLENFVATPIAGAIGWALLRLSLLARGSVDEGAGAHCRERGARGTAPHVEKLGQRTYWVLTVFVSASHVTAALRK